MDLVYKDNLHVSLYFEDNISKYFWLQTYQLILGSYQHLINLYVDCGGIVV